MSVLFIGCNPPENNHPQVDHEKVSANDDLQDIDQNVSSESVSNNSEELPDLTVHYINADQGDATLFQYDDYTILYDAGDWKNNHVVNYLHDSDVQKIDLIIISHPHADHLGQLDKIMDSFSVGEVWMTENVANTKVFQRAINAILQSEADFYEPEAGEAFDIGSMELHILHPHVLTGGLNEDSLSVHFTYGNIAFLFTGDAYKNEELMMIKSGYPLEADFLQLGHHGSNTSSHPDFIQAVNPTYAIYSAGHNNQYGHPHKEVTSYLFDKGINLL